MDSDDTSTIDDPGDVARVAAQGDVLIAFAARWEQAARLMSLGEPPDHCTIGDPARAEEFGPLLAARAELLRDFGTRIKSGGLWRAPLDNHFLCLLHRIQLRHSGRQK